MNDEENLRYSEMLSGRKFDEVFDDLGKLNPKDRAIVLAFSVELGRLLFLHETGQKIDLVWSERDSRFVELFDQRGQPTHRERLCIFFCLFLLDHALDLLEERNAL